MAGVRAARSIVVAFFASVLALPFVGGIPLAILVAVFVVGFSAWHVIAARRVTMDAGGAMMLAAFLLIGLAYAISNRTGTLDAIFALNFVLFAFYGPLTGGLGRFAAPGNLRLVAWLCLAGAALAFAVGLVQVVFLDIPRAHGLLVNPIASGTIALLLGFLALVGYVRETGWRRLMLLAGPVLGIGSVLLSGSRGPLLAVPVLAVLAATLLPIPRRIIVATAVTAVAIAGLYLAASPQMLGRVVAMGDVVVEIASGHAPTADESTSIRASMFRGAYAAFLESPWVGHGWPMKAAAAARHVDGAFPDHPRIHLHSDVLNFGVSAGILGLVAYILAVFAPLVSVLGTPRDSQYIGRRYGVAVLVGGYVVCGAVNLLLGFEFSTTFFVACAAILVGYCRDPAGAGVQAEPAGSA